MQSRTSYSSQTLEGGEDWSETFSSSTKPKYFRLLSDVYNDTEEIELADELIFMGVDEPNTYSQAVKDKEWKKAMKKGDRSH